MALMLMLWIGATVVLVIGGVVAGFMFGMHTIAQSSGMQGIRHK